MSCLRLKLESARPHRCRGRSPHAQRSQIEPVQRPASDDRSCLSVNGEYGCGRSSQTESVLAIGGHHRGGMALGDQGLLGFGKLDPGHEWIIGLVGHLAAIDYCQRVADQLPAGARVHEDIVEHEIPLDNFEQRHIRQRAGPQRANLLLQSQHGRRPFGGGADHFGEAHAQGEEFAQAGGHVEHRAADAHLVDVGGDHVRPVALRHQAPRRS